MIQIFKPCLFWFNVHWSGGSTAKADIETPIDDVKCFTGEKDYPTVEEMKNFVLGIYPCWTFKTKDDIIRIYPDKFDQ